VDQDYGYVDTNVGDENQNVSETLSGIRVAKSNQEYEQSPQVPPEDQKTLANDNTDFTFDLYAQLAKTEPPSDFFVSPYSISSALVMAFAGAMDETEKDMASTMHFSLPQDRLHPAFNSLQQELASRGEEYVESGKPFELTISNQLWGQIGFPFLQDFLDIMARNYDAGLLLVDFFNHTEVARKQINAWVALHTHNRIQDLLSPNDVKPYTKLVITNTIYFNAGWETMFDKSLTTKKTFHPLVGHEIDVDMMDTGSTISVLYLENEDIQIVALPYVGSKVEMVVILPKKGRFNTVEAGLDGKAFMDLITGMRYADGYVKMPVFGMNYRISMKKVLTDMGVAFTMVVDHPFVFVIYDRPTKTVLFVGRMVTGK